MRVNIDPNDKDENGKIILERRVSIPASEREVFNSNITNLRFIINGKLAEFEVNNSDNVLYAKYSCNVPVERFGDYPLFINNSTTNTKDIKKYSDFYTLIQVSDKIYKTNEYENPVSQEVIDKRNANKKLNPVKAFIPKDSAA